LIKLNGLDLGVSLDLHLVSMDPDSYIYKGALSVELFSNFVFFYEKQITNERDN